MCRKQAIKLILRIAQIRVNSQANQVITGPEVGFGDIASDLREARFRIVSELLTIHALT
jgi:hypothetical protein